LTNKIEFVAALLPKSDPHPKQSWRDEEERVGVGVGAGVGVGESDRRK
jgi:hypothetical protein